MENRTVTKAKEYRKEILDLSVSSNLTHIAPAFSIVEIMMVLFESTLNKNDKFILSKGHGALSLYIALRHKGFNPKITVHPEMDINEGIECTTGSLGHGLPVGVGMAFAKKYIKREKGKVYVLMSDGECQEGTTWESLLIASHHKLDNLVIIIDNNKIQSLDRVTNILSLDDLKSKFMAFNCSVAEINGHDIKQIQQELKNNNNNSTKVIIANTIKGKGFSLAEDEPVWHHRIPIGEELTQAYQELK